MQSEVGGRLTRSASRTDARAGEPPKGAEDVGPWRKPWENARQRRYRAPEGRKKSLPRVPLVAHTAEPAVHAPPAAITLAT